MDFRDLWPMLSREQRVVCALIRTSRELGVQRPTDYELVRDVGASIAAIRAAIGMLELAQGIEKRAATEVELDDPSACLLHILTMPLPIGGIATKESAGEWIQRVISRAADCGEAARILATHGLKVGIPHNPGVLAVANSHAGLAKIFAGTHWSGGSSGSDVWPQVLKRLPGAKASPIPLYFGGAICRATLIPLAVALPATEPAPEGSNK